LFETLVILIKSKNSMTGLATYNIFCMLCKIGTITPPVYGRWGIRDQISQRCLVQHLPILEAYRRSLSLSPSQHRLPLIFQEQHTVSYVSLLKKHQVWI
jgi:hypothetical protein